jgi:hypothetical protein
MLRSTIRVAAVLGMAALLAVPVAAQGTKYGEGVKLTTATPIETLLSDPGAWLGRTVRVDGIVTNVCEHAGCWLEISDEKSGKGVRFKVEDGVIVFPLTAKGHRASAEGTFELVQTTPDQHAAQDKEKDHAAHAEHGDSKAAGPSYQVRATGAVVY